MVKKLINTLVRSLVGSPISVVTVAKATSGGGSPPAPAFSFPLLYMGY